MDLASTSKFTLVVVDDDPVCRELLSANLKSVGYKILSAADGSHALSAASNGVEKIHYPAPMQRLARYTRALKAAA